MQTTKPSQSSLILAWLVVLVIGLYRIVAQEIFHYQPSEDLRALVSAGIVLAAFGLTYSWPPTRSLRPFLGLFIILIGVEWLVFTKLDHLPVYQAWLNNPSFNVYMLAEQSLRLVVSLVVIAVLFALKKSRAAFFLVWGELAAPVAPVRWMGVKAGETWNKFGRNLAFFISLGTLAFLVLAGHPPLDIVLKALPFFPAVLLAAALNAFNEEMTYKASFLSVLEEPVGKNQALWLMAAYFGIGHYYGVPYGVIGVLLAGFLGWLLGKAMLETRGFFWAWFIHFWQDVLIFSFLAIGSITPGGG